jgi:hypothetical protein
MTHADIDRMNLAANRIAVRLIETDPERKGLQIALDNIARWRANGLKSPLNERWELLIKNATWTQLRSVMIGLDDESIRLQQNSPFWNVLPLSIRRKLKKKFNRHEQKTKGNFKKIVLVNLQKLRDL